MLYRASMVAEFSHVLPPSHPLTLGGANSDWPIPSSVSARAEGVAEPPRLRIKPITYSTGLLTRCR